MWHWILDHGSAFNDIGMAWIAPVLLLLVATRLFRPGYRRPEAEAIRVRADDQTTEAQKPRSAA